MYKDSRLLCKQHRMFRSYSLKNLYISVLVRDVIQELYKQAEVLVNSFSSNYDENKKKSVKIADEKYTKIKLF